MTEITFWHGHLGSGKTHGMVVKAFMDYYEGRILLSNFPLRPPLKYFHVRVSQLMQMLHMLNPDRDYTLILDESHTDVEGRAFMSEKNREFSHFVAQLRKRNINFEYSSQWITGMETRVRQLTDYIIRCKAFRDKSNKDPKTNLIGLYYRKYDLVEEEIVAKWYVPASIAKFFYPLYDTKEIIDDDEGYEKEIAS